MLPLNISYNYEIVYHRQKERESLKSPFPCCFDRFFSFLHFLMAYFSTKSENIRIVAIKHYRLETILGLKITTQEHGYYIAVLFTLSSYK